MAAARGKFRLRARSNRERAGSRIEVRRSRIHGRGVYARLAIRKGARIIEYTGKRVSWESMPETPEDPRTFLFGLYNGKDVINAEIGGNEARWINHSCEPNCEAIEDENDRVFIHALRGIRSGEELSYDYALVIDGLRTKESEDEAACHCGAAKCRGNMLEPSERGKADIRPKAHALRAT
jgi:SET domain-containing protein